MQPADLLIIGGGINGAGIARDAAMRGLRTILVEQNDLGSGTSSRSSRLIHGGLRYLEQGELGMVLEANRERRTLQRIAPHLVWPLAFVFPVHRGDRISRWHLAAGMLLYDLLALFRNVRLHRMLGKRGMLEAEPMLRDRGLLGGARYYDAQCDDARLVIASARSAMHHGALVANYMAVVALERTAGRVVGAQIEDRLTGKRGRGSGERGGKCQRPLVRPGTPAGGRRRHSTTAAHQRCARRGGALAARQPRRGGLYQPD